MGLLQYKEMQLRGKARLLTMWTSCEEMQLPLKGPLMCMHYRISIMDGGFEPTCITLTYIAPRFHEFISGFQQ